MQALGLEQDLATLAAEHLLGRKLQDAALPILPRSSRKVPALTIPVGDDTLTPTLSRAREGE